MLKGLVAGGVLLGLTAANGFAQEPPLYEDGVISYTLHGKKQAVGSFFAKAHMGGKDVFSFGKFHLFAPLKSMGYRLSETKHWTYILKNAEGRTMTVDIGIEWVDAKDRRAIGSFSLYGTSDTDIAEATHRLVGELSSLDRLISRPDYTYDKEGVGVASVYGKVVSARFTVRSIKAIEHVSLCWDCKLKDMGYRRTDKKPYLSGMQLTFAPPLLDYVTGDGRKNRLLTYQNRAGHVIRISEEWTGRNDPETLEVLPDMSGKADKDAVHLARALVGELPKSAILKKPD